MSHCLRFCKFQSLLYILLRISSISIKFGNGPELYYEANWNCSLYARSNRSEIIHLDHIYCQPCRTANLFKKIVPIAELDTVTINKIFRQNKLTGHKRTMHVGSSTEGSSARVEKKHKEQNASLLHLLVTFLLQRCSNKISRNALLQASRKATVFVCIILSAAMVKIFYS